MPGTDTDNRATFHADVLTVSGLSDESDALKIDGAVSEERLKELREKEAAKRNANKNQNTSEG